MESLAAVGAAIFLVLLVLLAWRARASAFREAQRLEAEATRGRELESIAMDAASLLAATLQSIETARAVADDGDVREAVDQAAGAANALSSLFSATRLYLRADDIVVDGSADGCVRVAIAVARSRGCGISVRGERTGLGLRGKARAACDLIMQILEASRATLGEGEFVEVRLEEDGVDVAGGSRRALDLVPAGAHELGWTLELTRGDDGRAVARIRTSAPDDERAHAGALSPSRKVLH